MNKTRLPEKAVNLICQFIKERRTELLTRFPNKLLREDILDLLDIYCTVVYYPLEDKSNNGFHITGIPDKSGKDHHFVYINTNQTMEKQIFTAAHELGHVWKVDDYTLKNLGTETEGLSSEDIINRFAAELLMPEDEFLAVFDSECEKLIPDDGRTPLGNFLKIIAELMNHFFAPQKAVIYRLFELDRINTETLDLLLGDTIVPEEEISKFINGVLKENGYIKFLAPNNKKSIAGLSDLLDRAEKKDGISTSKIENMRQLFDLPKKQIESDMFEKMVDVSSREGET